MVSATWKRIFISIQLDLKNRHSFNDNTEITLRRGIDNFDRRSTQPVNAIVIDSQIIPKGAEVLCHHNVSHPTYEIFDYMGISGEEISSNKKYYSIPESECYAWRIANGEWNPAPGFEFGLRIFKPYIGSLTGLLPTQVKNKLYITTGELKGKAVMTKGACDYQIIFQDENGRENSLIRLRHFPNEEANIREEIIAIDLDTTDSINSGNYYIGLTPQESKTLN